MTTERIRVDKRLIKNIRDQYEREIIQEHNIIPTSSNLVIIALLELESFKTGREIEIKFLKNGKIYYKIK